MLLRRQAPISSFPLEAVDLPTPVPGPREVLLGIRACAGIGKGGRVLVGGLGMGFTLRAILDSLDTESRVTVAELHPIIEEWCRGPLAVLTSSAICSPIDLFCTVCKRTQDCLSAMRLKQMSALHRYCARRWLRA